MHLKRYYCESGKEDKILQDDVFIVSGERWQEMLDVRENESLPKTWNRFASARSIVLLGPPRQGKTTEFRYQCDLIENGFFLPLGMVPTMGGFEVFAQAIEGYERWMAWRTGTAIGELFIDSLDEGKLATPVMMRNLGAWLRSLEEPILRRLRIHLSCRGAEWDRADQDKWFNLFESLSEDQEIGGEKKCVEVLVLLDLARSQYEEYCRAYSVDPGQLLDDLPIRGKRFVARPQTLKMIVEDYCQSGKPPEIITELYERVIARRLGEENPEYQQATHIISIADKRSVAQLYAAITVLSDRALITDQEMSSLSSVPLGIGGDTPEVQEVTFNSGLFRAPLRGQYRFDDPELTNYLGACYLNGLINDGTISTHRVLRLFLANPEDMEPIPKLRGTMVWLCALNPGFRRFAVGINPGILLDDFPADLAVDDKLAAWRWLVKKYGDRRYFDYRPWMDGVKILACSEIVPHLKEVLENPAKYGRDIRSLALRISLAGKFTQLGPIIELCCKNLKDDQYFLTDAGDALKILAPDRIEILKTWLTLPPADDPNNRLLECALEALWPDHLSIHEVVSYLRPPMTRDGSYGLFGFLYGLSDRLAPDDRGVLIDAMAKDLEMILQKKVAKRPDSSDLLPSQWIMKYLISQICAWKNDPVHLPRLEKWISTALRARRLLGIYFPDHENFLKLIEEDRNSQHSLELIRIRRVMEEKGQEFEPRKYWASGVYSSKPEDLSLWQETLLSWLDGDPRMVQVAWDYLYTSWNQADNPQEFVIWAENLSKKNDLIRNLWNEYNSCMLQDWRIKNIKRKEEQKAKQDQNRKYILENKNIIAKGELRLLVHLYNISELEKKSIEEEYGADVVTAYHTGLLVLWENVTMPPLSNYYVSNQIPWIIILIIEATNVWRSEKGTSWADISESMRRTALQAGLSDLNKFPDWYEELVEIEPDVFYEIAFLALDLEANSKIGYPKLARQLKHHASCGSFRNIAFEYLRQNPAMRSEVLIPLAEAQFSEKLSDEIIDFLLGLGRLRLQDFGRYSGLRILALVWLYRAEIIWKWLNDNFLGAGEARIECFKEWIDALSDMHVSHRFGGWPSRIDYSALMALMPDYFTIYPLKTDPDIEEINKNIPRIRHRSDLANLRNYAMAKISESGSAEAGKFLADWASTLERGIYRDHILYHLDRWHQATAEKGWQPFSPQDLMGILTQGLRPVRSHEELYALVLDIIGEIKPEIEGGQDDLKRLFWIFENKQPKAPAEETNLQIVLAREIRQSTLRSRILGNREVTVTDENRPDFKVESILESGQRATIYIEVKRQMHPEIITAIESQLSIKYLIDPQSRYGIYFVGWYGDFHKFWKAPQKYLKAICGDIPKTPKCLDACLQHVADKVVRKRDDIDGIKVIVVDLSLQSAQRL